MPEERDGTVLCHFGGFTLDLQRHGLYKGSERVHLTPKPLEVLIHLVSNRGRTVEKRELLDVVWSGVFVTEDNLVQAIIEIRRAVGDNKDDPQFILTVPRQGYRFVAEVTLEGAPAKPPTATNPSFIGPNGNRRLKHHFSRNVKGLPRLPVLSISALLIVGVAVGLYMVLVQRGARTKPYLPFEKINVTRVTTSGKVTSAAVSPDGRYVVYALNKEGLESLWLRHTATASDVQIAKPEEILHQGLTFSPDGSSLYYIVRDGNALGELYQMAILGGVARKLIADVDSAISFSADGKRISFFRGYPETNDSKLVIANVDGTQSQELVTRRRPDFFPTLLNAAPSWSPVRAVIACPAGSNNNPNGRMTVVAIQAEAGTIVPMTSRRWREVGHVAWLPDGSGLVMLAKERASDPMQIWYLSYPTGEARRITNDLNNYVGVSLTRTRPTAIVTVQSNVLASILIAPDESNPRELPISSLDGVAGISWTPDDRLVYTARLNGNQDLYLMDQDGGNQRQLTSEASDNNWPSVSPDGRYIIFMSNRTGSNHIWRMNIDGSNPIQLTSNNDDRWPIFTPNGKAVIYAAVSEPAGLFKVSIDGGNPVRLTDASPTYPAISPDGKQIATGYFKDSGANKTAIYPSEGGAPLKILNLSSFYLRWATDGHALAYIDRHRIPNIVTQAIAGGAPKQLTRFKDGTMVSFDWSRAGRLACSRKVVIADAVIIRDLESSAIGP